MRVRSTTPHIDGTGTRRDPGDEYELPAGNELDCRLKDYLVVPVIVLAQADGADAPADALAEPPASTAAE